METKQHKQDLEIKRELLQKAVIQLKKEFVGIDSVIEQIERSICSWLFFPEIQDRPVVINLWGLTGTGKTSLIKRMVQLLHYEDKYFRFDLGESTGRSFDIEDTFTEIYDCCDGQPFIIALDEFQLARTINEDQEEIDKPAIRAIWDLLDSGTFEVIGFDYNMLWFNKFIKKLDLMLEKGVEVENGVVVANAELFKEEMMTKNDTLYFVSDDNVDTIHYMLDNVFFNEKELRKRLNELDGEKTINYLISLYKKAMQPKTVDCTKSLVFIMGNLDEIYSMTYDFNPDMSADEFHRRSNEITVTQVKNALLGRFRSEQIARLGNRHIVYPAFSQDSFYKIIGLELDKIKKKISETYNLNIRFDLSVEKLIYDEGVYPTQGTRPLFTTINQIVSTRLGAILNEVYVKNLQADTLNFSVSETVTENDCAILNFDFLCSGKEIHSFSDYQPLVLGKLRKEKQDDIQAIVAVHESGHAVLSSILMHSIPETVVSVTADSESSGFVLSNPVWNYISKNQIVNRLAVLLGGFVAEQIIFGDENVTIGSSSDLRKATSFATYAVYSCGMGKLRVAFGNEHMSNRPSIVYDNGEESANKEAKELLIKAEELAKETLIREKVLLIKMADYLSDKRSLTKEQVKSFIVKYAIGFKESEIIENADHVFYRNHLKNMVKQIN